MINGKIKYSRYDDKTRILICKLKSKSVCHLIAAFYKRHPKIIVFPFKLTLFSVEKNKLNNLKHSVIGHHFIQFLISDGVSQQLPKFMFWHEKKNARFTQKYCELIDGRRA